MSNERSIAAAAQAVPAVKSVREQLLDSMTIVGFERTYFIGPFTKRVSFASQQTRALNLVWAMFDTKVIEPNAHVAVVGGGLAGTTAAAALLKRNIKVTLFEQTDRYFPLQSQTAIRFVHPTINFWPQMPLSPTTDLPLLVWSSNICADLISDVQEQWLGFVNKLTGLKKPRKVLGVQRDQPAVRILEDGREHTMPFDAVIVATGYGLEVPLPGTVAPSYWDNADLIRVGQPDDTFLVSGTGDGGVLEVLRLVYPDFDFGRLTVVLAKKLDDTSIAETLREAESYAMTTADRGERCKRLEAAYMGAMIPETVVTETKATVKAPGKVRLVARDGLAFTPDSAPIHRLMLAHAIRANAVEIEAGELISNGDDLFVVEAPIGARYVDEKVVVARHGTSKAISELLTSDDVNSLRNVQESLSKYQYEKFWPDGFFLAPLEGPDGAPGSLGRMKSRLKYADHLKSEWPGALFFAVMRSSADASWEYHLVVDANDPSFDATKVPAELFGRPLRIAYHTVASPTAVSSENGPTAGSPKRPLRIGDKVESTVLFGGRKWVSGRVGCFVRRQGRDGVFALTAAHVFDDDQPAGVHARIENSPNWKQIGAVESRSHAIGLDVVAVHLKDDVSFESNSEIQFDQTLSDEELENSTVTLATPEGGGRLGIVRGLAVNVPVNLPNGVRGSLAEAIVISAQDKSDLPFTSSGDSGALVINEEKKPVGFAIAADAVSSFIAPFDATLRALKARALTKGRIVQLTTKAKPDHGVGFKKVSLPDKMHNLDLLAYLFRDRGPHGLSAPVRSWHGVRRVGAFEVRPLEVNPAKSPGLVAGALPRIRGWADHPPIAGASIYHFHGLLEFVRAVGLTRPRDLRSFSPESINLREFGLENAPRGESSRELSAHTIERAIKGKPVTLQAATLILNAVEETVQARGFKPETLYGTLQIVPAVFLLRGWASEDARLLLQDTVVATSIDNVLGHDHALLLREMAEGRFVTERTARAIQQFLKFVAWGHAELYSPVVEESRRGRAASVEKIEHLEAVLKVLEEEIERRS